MNSNRTKKVGTPSRRGNAEHETIRFNLYLPKESYEALERLQQLTGKRSLAETIRSALKLYHVVQQGIQDGKDVMMIDRESKERDRLVIY